MVRQGQNRLNYFVTYLYKYDKKGGNRGMKKVLKQISSILFAFIFTFNFIIPAYAEEVDIQEQIVTTENSIETAQDTTENIDTVVSENLETGAEAVDVIETNVETVLDINTELAGDLINLETVLNSTEEKVSETIIVIETAENKENTIIQNSDDAISNADIANTTNSKKEAYQAKNSAENNYQTANDELTEVQKSYDQAQQELSDLQDQYKDIEEQKSSIEKKIADAEGALATAKTNSTAALEALKAAQQRLVTLQDEQDALSAKKEDLESIEQQYYATMVYYYRDLLGNKVKYDDEGHLDLEENAALADQISDNKAKNPNKEVMKLSRNLMEQLIKFMVKNNGADMESLEFAIEGKDTKETAEGEVFTNNKGQDQTKLIPTEKQKWDNVSGENGRNNHITVKYMKDGEEVVEYYNYIFKDSDYKDSTDLNAGPIYLALVSYNNETKKWESVAVNDENNYDDYIKLTETLNAINNLKDYSDAKAAVDAAEKEVEKLDTELQKLKVLRINQKEIDKVKEKLNGALQKLEDASKLKASLEDKVEEARKAVEGIDLSRFNIREEEDEDDDPVPVPTIPSTPVVPLAPTVPVLPTISTPVVAGGGSPIAIEDIVEEVPTRDLGEFVNLEDEELPAAPSITLKDDELPGAQEAETETETKIDFSWWILILLIILALLFLIYAIKKMRDSSDE